MSATSTVPDGVPSVFHRRTSLLPTAAAKNIVSPTTSSWCGLPSWVRLVSANSPVPERVPSVRHSSRPSGPPSAAK